MRGVLRMTLLATAVMGFAGTALAEDWKLEKEDDGVKVFLSPVAGSKYKAYRGVVDIKADVAKINALQEDVAGSCKWIHACAEMRLLKTEGDNSWTYSKIDMPWPVTGRDVVIHVTTEKTADGGLIRHLKAEPSYIPEEKGEIRVPKLIGEWKLVPKGAGVTEVTYQVQTEPGGSIPSWLANSFVVDAPMNTLKGLRSAAEK
ncbi:START domain-containing protein [Pseudomonas sp. GD04087]|uniref:START domain-containing protein n=1 Tax=Pseudomonas TaxID=286 RepID=UPI001F24AC22|nr:MULTISPECIES: START domain-containing protein [Pseudomonas]MDH0288966.1 START domain-containing protein [Pseudomonas sp. GD04087]MDH1051305.1 START domain-containing protein [Pseudomonas sp. GD03903]MDH1999169.1 START domain-containing protein [Pseudomonas sp. GD03691]